jgi:tRNA A37 threonylcarbamoyltransferase TsaD
LLLTLLTDKVAQEELLVAVLLNVLLLKAEVVMTRKFRDIHVVRLTEAPGLTYTLLAHSYSGRRLSCRGTPTPKSS